MAQLHRDELAGPLGFTRDDAPHQTTLGRGAARDSVAGFRVASAGRLGDEPLDGGVDGKTGERAQGAEGRPLQALNDLAHGVKMPLADRPGDGEKKTEPEALESHPDELFAAYPGRRGRTGDAL